MLKYCTAMFDQFNASLLDISLKEILKLHCKHYCCCYLWQLKIQH